MTFPEFLEAHYKPEPGCAVLLGSIIRHFYESDTLASFDNPPDKIRLYLESRFPVGTFNREAHCGNVSGHDSILVSDRALVINGGELLPRDLTRDEMDLLRRETGRIKLSANSLKTLTRNQMTVRGWGRRTVSRAESIRSMKTDY